MRRDVRAKTGAPETPEAAFNLVDAALALPAVRHQVSGMKTSRCSAICFLRGKCSPATVPSACAIRWSRLVTGALFRSALALGRTPAACLVRLFRRMVALALIDWDTTLLPDDITLAAAVGGPARLGASGHWILVALVAAVWGAVAGYLSLWLVYWAFKLATGKEGMGLGTSSCSPPWGLVWLAGAGAHHPDGFGHRRLVGIGMKVSAACAKAAMFRSGPFSLAPA
jgi:leader peptidase (prepilin peptidase)/N-methyltransferase